MPSMQLGGISPRRAECPIFAEREMLVKNRLRIAAHAGGFSAALSGPLIGQTGCFRYQVPTFV
jgi:hypothetical protein